MERALMEHEMDSFPFVLAERLHLTLAQIGEMSNAEYVAWRAFHVYRNAMEELAAQERR
jgi:2'-5' RNA ligase